MEPYDHNFIHRIDELLQPTKNFKSILALQILTKAVPNLGLRKIITSPGKVLCKAIEEAITLAPLRPLRPVFDFSLSGLNYLVK